MGWVQFHRKVFAYLPGSFWPYFWGRFTFICSRSTGMEQPQTISPSLFVVFPSSSSVMGCFTWWWASTFHVHSIGRLGHECCACKYISTLKTTELVAAPLLVTTTLHTVWLATAHFIPVLHILNIPQQKACVVIGMVTSACVAIGMGTFCSYSENLRNAELFIHHAPEVGWAHCLNC